MSQPPVVDYSSPGAAQLHKRPPGEKAGRLSCVCSLIAIGLPEFCYYVLEGGHPHMAFELAGLLFCVSAPLLIISLVSALVAEFGSRHRSVIAVLAWVLILAQGGMWYHLVINERLHASERHGAPASW